MRNTLLCLIFAGALALTACQSELYFVPDDFRSSSAEIAGDETAVSVVFSPEAGSATITFETNKEWSAAFVDELAKQWCSISIDSGKKGTFKMTINVTTNINYDERSAGITLSCEGISRTIVVTQKQRIVLLLSDAAVELPGHEVSFAIKVGGEHPDEYNVTLSHRWLWAGKREVCDGCTLIWILAQAHTGVDPREGFIALEREGVSIGDTVSVTQYVQMPGFSFSTTQREVKAPVLDADASDTWILWGDGSFERYEAGLTHCYTEPIWHDIRVEGRSLAPLKILAPENGMKIDFSGLKEEEEAQ